jgi:hypothetical protein
MVRSFCRRNGPAVQGIHAIRQLWESLLAAGYRNAAFELDEIEHWEQSLLRLAAITSKPHQARHPRGRSRQVRGPLAPHAGWPSLRHCEYVVQRPLALRDFVDGDREAVAVGVGNYC